MTINGVVLDLASSFKSRFKGLMHTNDKSRGLILLPCNSIHTFGMKFPIDVLFFDKDCVLHKKVSGVQPNRLVFGKYNTYFVIEIPSEQNACGAFQVGMKFNELRNEVYK